MKAQLILASILLTPALALAQQGPPPPSAPAPPPMQMHGHQSPGTMQHPDREGGPDRGHDMMGMLPPGMWWKDPRITADLALTPDQQKKMEDIFIQSRTRLIQLHADLEKQQLLFEPVIDANPVNQPLAIAYIARIADVRADLERTNANMLLSMRCTLTPDQWTKLQAQHHGHQDHGPQVGHGSMHGPAGPPPSPLDDIQ